MQSIPESCPTSSTGEKAPPSDGQVNNNLFTETREMVALSYLVYAATHVPFSNIECCKQVSDTRGVSLFRLPKTKMRKSFSPAEIKSLVQNAMEDENLEDPFDEGEIDYVYNVCDTLQKLSPAPAVQRPLTLVQLDIEYQDRELAYAISRDTLKNRITVIFRGTYAKTAFKTNWQANLEFPRRTVDVPEVLKGKVKGDSIRFHSGFHDYLFRKTADKNDDDTKRKYDDILEQVRALLKLYPQCKLYVTGHSLGGALSTIAAFYFACESDLPKPVTCVNFASPRVGDKNSQRAMQALEQEGSLRLLRVVNNNDSVASTPSSMQYRHAGFQIRLYRQGDRAPKLSYPRINMSSLDKILQHWDDSLLASINARFDHCDYPERIDQAREFLEKLVWESLYNNQELTGFPPPSVSCDI